MKFLLIFLLFIFNFINLVHNQQDLPVVSNFEVERYLGHWYLIASIPKVFDFYCICSETTYTLDPTNSSKVNFDEACRASFTWAPVIHSKSYAEIDPENNAKWTNVNTIVGSLTAKADYYIFYLESSYQWAAVGARDRASLYILARDKSLDQAVYDDILQKASNLGFDTSKMEKNKQICNETLISY